MKLTIKKFEHVEERKVPTGRKLTRIKGFVTKNGAIHVPTQARRAFNPNKDIKLPPRQKKRAETALGIRKQNDKLPENIKHLKDFRTDDGDFSTYAWNGDIRQGEVTVHKSKDGYTMRNILLSDGVRGKGIGSQIYQAFNKESLDNTGNPLRSTKPRKLANGTTVHELSNDAKKVWDRFVSDGKAIKNDDGSYQFKGKNNDILANDISTDSAVEPVYDNMGKQLSNEIHQDKPETWGISRRDVDDAIERVFNKQKDSYDTHKEWLDSKDEFLNNGWLAETLNCDYDLYTTHIQKLPEGMSWVDVLDAYNDGKLPLKIEKPKGTPAIKIPNNVKAKPFGNLGEPQNREALSKDDLLKRWESANKKVNKNSKQEVQLARTELFLEYMSNPNMAETMGMPQSAIQKKMKSWSNISVKDRILQQRLNEGYSSANQWTGITNLNYISQQNIGLNSIDGFVKDIKAPAATGWMGAGGDMLRRNISDTLSAIDTRLSYKDLSFRVVDRIEDSMGNDKKSTLGTYNTNDKRIDIKHNSKNVISHEIGHYLDNKWGEELGFESGYASSVMQSANVDYLKRDGVSDNRIQWHKRVHEFVNDLSRKSDISSEYTQDRKEVFARFVAKFVDWTSEKAGRGRFNEHSYSSRNDRFGESDYINFVKLLQEKSYIDIEDSKGTK